MQILRGAEVIAAVCRTVPSFVQDGKARLMAVSTRHLFTPHTDTGNTHPLKETRLLSYTSFLHRNVHNEPWRNLLSVLSDCTPSLVVTLVLPTSWYPSDSSEMRYALCVRPATPPSLIIPNYIIPTGPFEASSYCAQ